MEIDLIKTDNINVENAGEEIGNSGKSKSNKLKGKIHNILNSNEEDLHSKKIRNEYVHKIKFERSRASYMYPSPSCKFFNLHSRFESRLNCLDLSSDRNDDSMIDVYKIDPTVDFKPKNLSEDEDATLCIRLNYDRREQGLQSKWSNDDLINLNKPEIQRRVKRGNSASSAGTPDLSALMSNSGNFADLKSEVNKQHQIKAEENKKTFELRRNYVYKLMTSKLWSSNEQHGINCNSIIIYDWDDTLFFTSFLGQNNLLFELYANSGPNSIKQESVSLLNQIEQAVFDVLSISIEKGDTYIISNSSKGWVEHSCGIHFKSLSKLLNKIKIISSRALYEIQYPKNYKMWKIKAFLDLVKQYNTLYLTNIISIGDSQYEIDAAHVLGSNFRESYVKTIKLKANPNLKELLKQLTMIKMKFMDVFQLIKNLNMKVERKEKGFLETECN